LYISPPGLIEIDGNLIYMQDNFEDYYEELLGSDDEEFEEEGE
jgi:hypothetical protein